MNLSYSQVKISKVCSGTSDFSRQTFTTVLAPHKKNFLFAKFWLLRNASDFAHLVGLSSE